MSEPIYPIYYLIAEDHDKMKAFVAQLEKRIFPNEDERKTNTYIFYPDDMPTRDILQQCYQFSMFTNNQIVKVYQAEKLDAKSLDAYFNALEPRTVLILLRSSLPTPYKKAQDLAQQINKIGKYLAFTQEEGKPLQRTIHDLCQTHQLELTEEAIQYILETIDPQTHQIQQFFDLLSNYPKGSEPISRSILQDIMGSGRLPTQNEYITAILERHLDTVIYTFRSLYHDGNGLTTLMNWIYFDFKIIYQMKCNIASGMKSFDAWTKARPFPYWGKDRNQVIQQSELTCQKWSFSQLEKAFMILLDLEIFLKSGDAAMHPLFFEHTLQLLTQE